MEKIYNDLSKVCAISAREYFMILRLAIYHIDGKYIATSVDIMEYEKTEEIYKQAIKVMLALNERKMKRQS